MSIFEVGADILFYLYQGLLSITAGEWLLFSAEIAVAAVIYFELEHTRRSGFLEKATGHKSDQERRDIYAACLPILTSKQSRDEKENAVMNIIFKEKTLKIKIDNEIGLFNQMGFMTSPWLSRKRPLVEIFPHAPVYIWLIVRPYVLQRREDAGSYFARHYFRFTRRCLDFVIEQNGSKGLHLRNPDGSDGYKVSYEELRRMREELRMLAPRFYERL